MKKFISLKEKLKDRMKERYLTKSAVFLLIQRPDGKFLFQRRQNTGYQDGMLDLGASGHVEAGETAKEAAQRELKEETGLTIDLDRLAFKSVNHRQTNGQIYYDFYFMVQVSHEESNQVKIMEPDKNTQMLWLAKGEFTDEIIDYNRVVIDNLGHGIYYQEIGWKHNI